MTKKKKLVGKGIRALLRNMDNDVMQDDIVQQSSSTIAKLRLEQIEVNPFQPRVDIDQESLKELAESIKIHGLIQPLTVRRLDNKKFQLISGERRLRASKIAKLKEVPTYIRVANDQEMLEMALIENIQREDLNAMEVGYTYQRLLDECNLTHDSLSERVGKRRSTVSNYIRLLKLPPDIQLSLKKANISMGHARALLGLEDIALQLMVFKEIISKSLSVRATEALIRAYRTKKTPKNVSKISADHQNVQDNLRSYLGTRVNLKTNKAGKGQIVINFTSDSDLNRLLDLIEK